MSYSGKGVVSRLEQILKTIMDYAGAVIALILFSPVMLWVAWRIKRENDGSVFFQHTSLGKNLKPFRMYKFSTMVPDAEKRLEELLKDEKNRVEFEVAFKFKEDPRVTKFGRFLRNTSLNELPQLFNVLKGEMSLIGPRPVSQREIDLYYTSADAREVFSVKPGMTGYWQVNGRSDVEYGRRIEMELYYVRHWSLWLDIVILFRTVRVVLSRKGAY